MLTIPRILTADRICLQASVKSRKKALELCAGLLAQHDAKLDQDAILEALTAREKLGSTAMEKGLALPHCRVEHCSRPLAAIVTLSHSIDYDARDDRPVDILWALIVPAESGG